MSYFASPYGRCHSLGAFSLPAIPPSPVVKSKLGGGSVSSGTASAYSAVTLTAGQTLYGEAGCEVLLRSGSAACGGTGTASMTDATTGGSLNGGGALEGNHLYLMPESQSVFTAEGAVLLVRGSFIIGS